MGELRQVGALLCFRLPLLHGSDPERAWLAEPTCRETPSGESFTVQKYLGGKTLEKERD